MMSGIWFDLIKICEYFVWVMVFYFIILRFVEAESLGKKDCLSQTINYYQMNHELQKHV